MGERMHSIIGDVTLSGALIEDVQLDSDLYKDPKADVGM